MEVQSQRDDSLDGVCGLLIIWMISMHAAQWSGVKGTAFFNVATHVFFYFMPWFYFKGGMFATVKDEKVIAWGGVKRLLVPFAIYTIIGTGLHWISLGLDGESNWKIYLLWPIKKLLLEGSTPGNEPLWFLISLYLVRIIYNYIAEWKYLDTILVLLLIMFYLLKFVDILNISEMLVYPFYLYSSFVGLLFYRAGYMLKNAQYKSDVFWISVLCVIVISLLVPAQFDFRAISGDKSSKGDFLIFVIYSISACVVINNIFRYLYSECDIKILTKIGKDSMFYYCIHWILLLFLNLYVGHFDIQLGWEQFALYIMGLVVLLPFFKKYQNKFFLVF